MSNESIYFDVAADGCNQTKLKQACHNTLILTCSEPQSTNLDLMPGGIGSAIIVKTAGGLAGLTGRTDVSKHWLAEYLRAFSGVDRVIICAHNDCCYASSSQFAATNAMPMQTDPCCLKLLELAVQSEIEILRTLISSLSLHQQPMVMGCIYDRDYDWLTIHDDETNLFLPTNVYKI